MLDFLNLKIETFGLDINDTSFKITKLKKKHGFLQLVSYGEKIIPKDIIEEGVIKDENGFIKTLKLALTDIRGEKLKTKYVVASLPEQKSFSQVIKMPKMEEKELKTAIVFEAENYIPLPSEQMYLDYKIISPKDNKSNHLDIFLVAVEKKIVDSYVSCLKKAGLIPVALESETQLIAKVLIKDEKSLNPIVLIDIGGDSSSLAVFAENAVRFTSSLSISSRKITESIIDSLGISLREAEHMKTKYGVGLKNPNHRAKAVVKATEPILNEMLVEIKKYLDFCAEHDFSDNFSDKKNKVEKIILSGGGASLKGIEEFLSKKLNICVEIGDPWINFSNKIKNKISPDFTKKSLSFVTSLGLSLTKIDIEKFK